MCKDSYQPYVLWDKEMVRAQLCQDAWVCWGIGVMSSRQDAYELKAKSSFIANGIGLSKFDAYPVLTCRQLLLNGQALSPELIEDCRHRLHKYAGQLADALNAQELQRAENEGIGPALASYRSALAAHMKKNESKPRNSKPRPVAKSLETDICLMRHNLTWAETYIMGKYCAEPKPPKSKEGNGTSQEVPANAGDNGKKAEAVTSR